MVLETTTTFGKSKSYLVDERHLYLLTSNNDVVPMTQMQHNMMP